MFALLDGEAQGFQLCHDRLIVVDVVAAATGAFLLTTCRLLLLAVPLRIVVLLPLLRRALLLLVRRLGRVLVDMLCGGLSGAGRFAETGELAEVGLDRVDEEAVSGSLGLLDAGDAFCLYLRLLVLRCGRVDRLLL